MTQNIYQFILVLILASSLPVFLLCFWKPGSYGRHASADVHLTVPVRTAWLIMEVPAVLSFLYFYLSGPNRSEPVALLLLGMWLLHYVHRALIYPLQLRPRPGAGNSLRTTIEGAIYCTANGFINGYWIGHLADFDGAATLQDPRLILGVAIFAFGFALNKHSDSVLLSLRKDSPGQYLIPYGGAFRWVSSPNYLGEILTWLGFAIACWSLPALSFLLFTCANLIPRAVLNHRWYNRYFTDYPVQRKAIIPSFL